MLTLPLIYESVTLSCGVRTLYKSSIFEVTSKVMAQSLIFMIANLYKIDGILLSKVFYKFIQRFILCLMIAVHNQGIMSIPFYETYPMFMALIQSRNN